VGFLYAFQGASPASSQSQYRCSVLAQMAPEMEQGPLYNALNFDHPIAYQPTAAGSLFWPFYVANTTVMAMRVSLFVCRATAGPRRCPSRDRRATAFARATAQNGARPRVPRRIQSWELRSRSPTLIDGTSQTAAASEQRLGIAGPYSQTTPTPVPSPRMRAMARVVAGPLTDATCAAAGNGWLLNKGAGWWDGNYLCTLYKPLPDPQLEPGLTASTYHKPGLEGREELPPRWRQLLFCDGTRRVRA